jgi:hypothetical protein
LLDGPPETVQALVVAAPRPIAIAAVLELHLVDGLKNPFDLQPHQLVFIIADGERPPFLASRLGNIGAPPRLRPVAHVPQPARELLDVLLQIRSIAFLRDAINPRCPICGQCFEAGAQVIQAVLGTYHDYRGSQYPSAKLGDTDCHGGLPSNLQIAEPPPRPYPDAEAGV